MRKVNVGVLREWISKRVTEILKIEDDVVIEYAISQIDDAEKPVRGMSSQFPSCLRIRLHVQQDGHLQQMPDPREIQINLGGFMDSYGAASFTSELWTLLLSAQETVGGVPAAVS